MDEKRGRLSGGFASSGSGNGSAGSEGGGKGLFRPARVRVPVASLCCWTMAVLLLLFFPPKFIGDYNVRICIVIVLWILFNTVAVLLAQSIVDQRVRVAVLVTLVLLFPVVAIYSMSHFSNWCCVSHADFDRLCSLASRTADRLQAFNIPYWVCWGSLLGAVRDYDMPYQAIPWEHDFDICVHDADWQRFVGVMGNYSEVRFDEQRKIVYDTNLRTTMARAYVDVYKYTPSEKNPNILETHEGSSKIMQTAKDTIYPLSSIRVCNREFSAPANPSQAVIDIYGKSYMEPHWPGGLTGYQCRMYADCTLLQRPV